MKKSIVNLFRQGFQAAAAVSLISLFSFTNAASQDLKGQAVVSSVSATVTVTKINHKTRKVHIKTEDGQKYKFAASTDVQNLDQVKKGDVITVVYTEALAYDIKNSGTAGVGASSAAALAATGEKPAGAAAQQTTVTFKITAINTKAPSITVMGPEGDEETIKVKDPSKLNGLKVGDTVDVTYVEAFAIKVDPAAKK